MNTPDFALRLQHLREQANLTAVEVAHHIGVSPASYFDLETYDDLVTSVSINQVCKLVHVLKARVEELFDIQSDDPKTISHQTLSWLIEDFMRRSGITIDVFEDQVGWNIGPLLTSDEAVLTWNIEQLQDVCRLIEVSWVEVLRQTCTCLAAAG